MPAVSRTERVSTPGETKPPQPSPASGPTGSRPRLAFIPKSPQAAAGMRMEPPPSPACPTGTARAATSAALPPLDPPGVCARFQGLWVAPRHSGSVVPRMPSSGQLLLATGMKPARR